MGKMNNSSSDSDDSADGKARGGGSAGGDCAQTARTSTTKDEQPQRPGPSCSKATAEPQLKRGLSVSAQISGGAARSSSPTDNKENSPKPANERSLKRKLEQVPELADQSLSTESSSSDSVSADSESSDSSVDVLGLVPKQNDAKKDSPNQGQNVAHASNSLDTNDALNAMHGRNFGLRVPQTSNMIPVNRHMRKSSKKQRRENRQRRRNAKQSARKGCKRCKKCRKASNLLSDRTLSTPATIDLHLTNSRDGTQCAEPKITSHPLFANAFGRRDHTMASNETVRSGLHSHRGEIEIAKPKVPLPVPFFGAKHQSYDSPPTATFETDPPSRFGLHSDVQKATAECEQLMADDPAIQAVLYREVQELSNSGCPIKRSVDLRANRATGAFATVTLQHPALADPSQPLPDVKVEYKKPKSWSDMPDRWWYDVFQIMEPNDLLLVRNRPPNHRIQDMLREPELRLRGGLLALRLERRATPGDREKFLASFPDDKRFVAESAPNPCLVVNDSMCFATNLRIVGTQTILSDYTNLRHVTLDTAHHNDASYTTQAFPKLATHIERKKASVEKFEFRGSMNVLRGALPLFQAARKTLLFLSITLTNLNDIDLAPQLYQPLFHAISSLEQLQHLSFTSSLLIQSENAKNMIMDRLIRLRQLRHFDCNCMRIDPEDAGDLVGFNHQLTTIAMIDGRQEEPPLFQEVEGVLLGGEAEMQADDDGENDLFSDSDVSVAHSDPDDQPQQDAELHDDDDIVEIHDNENVAAENHNNHVLGVNEQLNQNGGGEQPPAVEPNLQPPLVPAPAPAAPASPQQAMLNILNTLGHVILLTDVHFSLCTRLASQFVNLMPFLQRITILTRSARNVVHMLRQVLNVLKEQPRGNPYLVIRLVHHSTAYQSLADFYRAIRGMSRGLGLHSDYPDGAVDIFNVHWWQQCRFFVQDKKAIITVVLCSMQRVEPELRASVLDDQSGQSAVEIPHQPLPNAMNDEQLEEAMNDVELEDPPNNDGINLGPMEDMEGMEGNGNINGQLGDDNAGNGDDNGQIGGDDAGIDDGWIEPMPAFMEDDLFQAMLDNNPVALGMDMNPEQMQNHPAAVVDNDIDIVGDEASDHSNVANVRKL